MRFLLDVCASSRSLGVFLAGQGHDVLSAVSVDPNGTATPEYANRLQRKAVNPVAPFLCFGCSPDQD
jgi:hypothetical protein